MYYILTIYCWYHAKLIDIFSMDNIKLSVYTSLNKQLFIAILIIYWLIIFI